MIREIIPHLLLARSLFEVGNHLFGTGRADAMGHRHFHVLGEIGFQLSLRAMPVAEAFAPATDTAQGFILGCLCHCGRQSRGESLQGPIPLRALGRIRPP